MSKLSKMIARDEAAPKLKKLLREGYSVVEFTLYQFRINERLDIFPTSSRWHDIRQNIRGSYAGPRDLIRFVKEFFSQAEAPQANRDVFIASLTSIGWTQQDAEKAWQERTKP